MQNQTQSVTTCKAPGEDASPSVILHLGTNQVLRSTRSSVLARTGFQVESLGDLGQVDDLLSRYRRGLLVLCHSLTVDQRADVLRKVQQQPGLTGLVIANADTVLPSLGPQVASIHIHQGPGALVLKATQLLSQ